MKRRPDHWGGALPRAGDRVGVLTTLVVAIVLVACGSGPASPRAAGENSSAGGLRVIVLPDAEGRMPSDAEIGCPGGPTFPAAALDGIRPLEGSGLTEIEAAMTDFLDGEEGRFWPQDGWQVLHRTGDMALLVHPGKGDGFAFITIEPVEGEWRWTAGSAGGPCPLRTSLRAGLNTVEWRVDPSAPPIDRDRTTVAVLATERECASGQAMGRRLLEPEVVATESAVLLAFAARPLPGVQECPGNPEQSVTVELPEPLGDRVLSDGLAVAGDLEDFLDRARAPVQIPGAATARK